MKALKDNQIIIQKSFWMTKNPFLPFNVLRTHLLHEFYGRCYVRFEGKRALVCSVQKAKSA